jgi:hypothetical protein
VDHASGQSLNVIGPGCPPVRYKFVENDTGIGSGPIPASVITHEKQPIVNVATESMREAINELVRRSTSRHTLTLLSPHPPLTPSPHSHVR